MKISYHTVPTVKAALLALVGLLSGVWHGELGAPASCPLTITITSSPFALTAADGPRVATLSVNIRNSGSAPLKNVTLFIGNGITLAHSTTSAAKAFRCSAPHTKHRVSWGTSLPELPELSTGTWSTPTQQIFRTHTSSGRRPRGAAAPQRALPSKRRTLPRQALTEFCPPMAQSPSSPALNSLGSGNS
jgi:hypothetical protein